MWIRILIAFFCAVFTPLIEATKVSLYRCDPTNTSAATLLRTFETSDGCLSLDPNFLPPSISATMSVLSATQLSVEAYPNEGCLRYMDGERKPVLWTFPMGYCIPSINLLWNITEITSPSATMPAVAASYFTDSACTKPVSASPTTELPAKKCVPFHGGNSSLVAFCQGNIVRVQYYMNSSTCLFNGEGQSSIIAEMDVPQNTCVPFLMGKSLIFISYRCVAKEAEKKLAPFQCLPGTGAVPHTMVITLTAIIVFLFSAVFLRLAWFKAKIVYRRVEPCAQEEHELELELNARDPSSQKDMKEVSLLTSEDVVFVGTMEEEVNRAHEICDKKGEPLGTVSCYSSMTLRGNTILTVLCVATSFELLNLLGINVVMNGGKWETGYVICGLGYVSLLATGLMPSQNPVRKRQPFLWMFPGSRWFVQGMHTGGILLFVLGTVVGGFLRLSETPTGIALHNTHDVLLTFYGTKEFDTILPGTTLHLCLTAFYSVMFSLIDNGRKKLNKPPWAPFGLFFEVMAVGEAIVCALRIETRMISFCWHAGQAETLIGGIAFIDWFTGVGVIFLSVVCVFFLCYFRCGFSWGRRGLDGP